MTKPATAIGTIRRAGGRTVRLCALVSLCTLFVAGCSSLRTAQIFDNPQTVASGNYEQVWQATVTVVEKYFDIASESRYDGRIVTKPQAAATLFEPFRPDSIGFRQRLQATLQTLRRQCFVLVQPAATGGFTITVEIYRELEDLPNPSLSQYAGGTLVPSIQPIDERVVTTPIRVADGWISLGRDAALEAAVLDEIRRCIDGF